MTTNRAKGTRRNIQAADTRALIVETAGRLFDSQGYVRTTIEAVATESGVALQTVYNSVGNKAALLSAVLDTAASGPHAPALVIEHMRDKTGSAPDLPSLLEVLADWFAEVNQRTGSILETIAQAAAVDPAIAEMQRSRALQRLTRYGEAARAVRTRGGLSSGMKDEEAAAVIFSLGHPQTYRTLVGDAGWTIEAYRSWILKALTAALA